MLPGRKMKRIVSSIVALVLAACGSVVGEDMTAGGAAGSGTGAAPTTSSGPATTATGAFPPPDAGEPPGSTRCPASQPAEGSSCAGVRDQLQCTYGDSVRPDCRELWTCTGGVWTTVPSACTEPAQGVCGTSMPARLSTCASSGDVCVFGAVLCECSDVCVLPGASPHWECFNPPPNPGCPPVVPNDGTTCATEGAHCLYGDICDPTGMVVDCTDGLWIWDTAYLANGGCTC